MAVNLNGALAGVTVLDFSQVGAGPTCGMLLGDLGADVVKVEAPAGDIGRKLGPPWQHGESVVSMSFNRNKLTHVLDEGDHLWTKGSARSGPVT